MRRDHCTSQHVQCVRQAVKSATEHFFFCFRTITQQGPRPANHLNLLQSPDPRRPLHHNWSIDSLSAARCRQMHPARWMDPALKARDERREPGAAPRLNDPLLLSHPLFFPSSKPSPAPYRIRFVSVVYRGLSVGSSPTRLSLLQIPKKKCFEKRRAIIWCSQIVPVFGEREV